MQENLQNITNSKTKTRKWGGRAVEALIGLTVLLVIVAISTPNLLRSNSAANEAVRIARMRSAALTAEPIAMSNGDGFVASATPSLPERMVVTTGVMSVVIADPTAAAQKLEAWVREAGGYVSSLESLGNRDGTSGAQITAKLRIPQAKFDQARVQVRQLGSKVTDEKIDAEDVTSKYVDMESTLRNYQAEEQQYLQILKRSGNIRDTLEVARQLSDVRGRIEVLQGQKRMLSHQIEMATLTVIFSSVPVVVGNEWHPMLNARRSAVDALDSLASYTDFLVTILVNVPLFILWPVTLLTAGGVAWRMIVWMWRKWFSGLFLGPRPQVQS